MLLTVTRMHKLIYFENVRVVLATSRFCVFVPETPHVDRIDGGHICISAIRGGAYCLQDLTDEELFELSVLQKLVGKSMIDALKNNGIDVRLVNYQINGNWTFGEANRPLLHLHLYGRAYTGKRQIFGQSLYFPSKKENPEFYADNQALTEDEIGKIRRDVLKEIDTRYNDLIDVVE